MRKGRRNKRPLIEERKNDRQKDKGRLTGVSKKIIRCIRDKKKAKRQEKIQQILEEFKGIKSITNIKLAREKHSFQKYVDIFRFERKRCFFQHFCVAGICALVVLKLMVHDVRTELDSGLQTERSPLARAWVQRAITSRHQDRGTEHDTTARTAP